MSNSLGGMSTFAARKILFVPDLEAYKLAISGSGLRIGKSKQKTKDIIFLSRMRLSRTLKRAYPLTFPPVQLQH